MKKLLALARKTRTKVAKPINIRESGLSRVCLAWHDSRDEFYYDSDYTFYALALVNDWFDKNYIAVMSYDEMCLASLEVQLAGSVCTEWGDEKLTDAIFAYEWPQLGYVDLGSPDGPLEESRLQLYPNGENKWVGVLQFGEGGADSIYIFTVALSK